MNISILKQLFSKESKLKAAFQAVHSDVKNLDESHTALKLSANEWIIYLNQENRQLKQKLQELEAKLEKITTTSEKRQLALLEGI